MTQNKTIKEQITSLIELQVLDKEIYALTEEKDRFPADIKAIEESLKNKKTSISKAEEALKGFQLKLKESEVKLQDKEGQINKLQTQLYQLKTNKEYSAMVTEIEGVKADNSIIEEEIIKLIDDVDAAKKKVYSEKESFQKIEMEAQKQKDVINNKAKDIDVKLSGLFSKREEIVPAIEKGILSRYEKVLKNRDGLGIVKVENNACSGCYMGLPPQVVSDAKLKEKIVVCGNCSRILYIDDDVEIN